MRGDSRKLGPSRPSLQNDNTRSGLMFVEEYFDIEKFCTEATTLGWQQAIQLHHRSQFLHDYGYIGTQLAYSDVFGLCGKWSYSEPDDGKVPHLNRMKRQDWRVIRSWK